MHSHTVLCGHAEGTVDDLVRAARAAHIATLAVTEHYPLSPAMDPGKYLAMQPESLPVYLDALDTARAAYPDVEIVTGCEFDWLGESEDRNIAPCDFEPFSLVLGSVHFIDGWAFDDPAEKETWARPGAADAAWKRYFELWCDAATSSLPFTVMAHPDLVKKFGHYPSYDVMPLFRQAAEAAAAGGRAVEVNTSGSYYDCKEMYPTLPLLAEFCRAGVPCTVGTDAHTPVNVARDIERAYAHMARAGYKSVTVFKADGDRWEMPLC